MPITITRFSGILFYSFCKFILFIFCVITPLLADELRFNVVHYTVENGLSSNIIWNIYQDKQGFMWFCTEGGLDRFDGYKFRHYSYIPGDSTSLSSGWVWAAMEDHLGNFWVATGNGLNLYDRYTDTFKHFYHKPDDSLSLISNNISDLLEDNNGTLWLATDNGLDRMDRTTMTFKHYLPGIDIGDLREGKFPGDIWLSTQAGFYRYDPSLEQVIPAITIQNVNEINRYTIETNLLLIDDKFYIAVSDKYSNTCYLVDLLNPGKKVKINKYVKSLYYDPDNDIIWAAGYTLFQHNHHGKLNSREVKLFIKGKRYLITAGIRRIIKDNAGSLWIATGGDGIIYLNELSSQFKHYNLIDYDDPANDPNSGLPGIFATDIASDIYGHLWYSTWHGVFRLSENRKSAIRYIKRPNIVLPTINILFKRRNGELWLASRHGTCLYRYRHLSNDFEYFTHDDANDRSLSSNDVTALFDDKSGRFWIGHNYDGLDLFDQSRNEFIHFRHEDERANSLSNNQIRAIADADSGRLWIGTRGAGLNLFDPANNTAVHFRYERNSEKGLSDDIINSILAIDDTLLWIATSTGGLNKLNTRTREFKHFMVKDGLPSNTVLNVISDLNGDIWIATENGLARIDKLTEKIKIFDYADGIINTRFTYDSSYLSEDGELFWGHHGGFTSVYPDHIRQNTFLPPVVLTNFQISNKSTKLDTTLSEKKHIVLTYDQNVFSFEFAALNYFAPEKNRYRYKMEGFDKEWINSGNRRFVSYTNLSPGAYTFHVKGSNNDGIWNEAGTSIKITILPPFWATWWAYSIYAILTMALIYFLRRYEVNRLRLKHNLELEHVEAEKLREVDQMKSRFFASISHEFRTPLTLIRGPVERLIKQISNKKQIADLKRIEDNAARMNKLVEMYLDLSRLESGNLQLQKEESDIIPSIKSIVASFESMAKAADIELQFSATNLAVVCLVDPEKFEMILINLLSNAIKFTAEGGRITTSVMLLTATKECVIRVSDSGIGIAQENLDQIFDMYYQVDNAINTRVSGTGIGLTMVKELVELHDGLVTVESEPGAGTIFTVTMSYSSYSETGKKSIALEKSEQAKPAEVVKTDEDKAGDKERILIVEDNHQMRDYIKSHLENDYQTILAANGKQGFDSAVKNNPTLIISDVMMPKMDGYEFCAKIKSDLRTSHIPVILLTAKVGEQDMFNGLEKGADNYLKKPFKAEELLLRMKNLIDNRKRLHRKFRTEQYTNFKEFNITSADETFLQKCCQIIEINITNPDFSVEEFARQMALSRSQLFRKIKALTGLSVNKYIQTIRLKKSATLLSAHSGNISQIAFDCGFSSSSYFAEAFKEMYGLSPTEYLKQT